MNRNFYGSRVVESTVQEQENLQTINTNNIKTNIINTDSINLQSDERCISLNDVKEKYDLKGQIRSNSNIMCEMVVTSDQKFFDEIGI